MAAAACCLAATPARADWISLSGAENAPSIAEIHVDEEGVRIELEIFVDDVARFERLIPDELVAGIGVERPPSDERMSAFSREDLQVLADGDRPLTATLEVFEPRLREERPSPNAGKLDPFTGAIIPGPPADRRVFFARLFYRFDTRPSSLAIVPPLGEAGLAALPIGFIAYHEGVPVTDFRYLPGAVNLALDWDDPWYSAFDQNGLKRWQRGSVMSFLYIEPLEVRHEVLVRVKELEAWMDLGLRGSEFIEADENEALKQRVGEFLLARDEVTIDGERLEPILDRTAFVKYSMTGSTFLEQPERLPINTATIGVILTYLTDRIPQEVRMRWDLWSDRVQQVPTDAIDPAGPFPAFVTPDDDVQVWTNFLKTYEPPTVVPVGLDESLTTFELPLASALCLAALLPLAWRLVRRVRRGEPVVLHAGLALLLVAAGILARPFWPLALARPRALAPKLAEEEAVAVLDGLLRNTYRSFDFRREEDVYDRLATSVSGPLLTDVYLDGRRSLEVTQAGGAQARVQEVEILDAVVEHLANPPLGMAYRARWTAQGSVSHWGHIHTRKNLYEADITVGPVDGAWKINALSVRDEKRIDPSAPRR